MIFKIQKTQSYVNINCVIITYYVFQIGTYTQIVLYFYINIMDTYLRIYVRKINIF